MLNYSQLLSDDESYNKLHYTKRIECVRIDCLTILINLNCIIYFCSVSVALGEQIERKVLGA